MSPCWEGQAIPNCQIQIKWIDSFVPVGSLYPTAIRVAVDLANCPGGDAVVRTDHSGQSLPTNVPALGAVIEVPITSPTTCGDKIVVEAWCASDLSCSDTQSFELPCTQCARVSPSASFGQCAGNPPLMPVTLSAQIGLAPGQSVQFYFDFDDPTNPTPGTPFTITNPATSPSSTVYTHIEPPHNYSPGSYVPKLIVIPPPPITYSECGPFPLPIKVQCAATCPTASAASVTDKGCVSVPGQGKMRRFELDLTVTTTPNPATAQWKVRKLLPGGGFGPAIAVAFGCPGGQVVPPAAQVPPGPQVVDLVAGDYEATLEFLYPFQNCPGVTLNFTAAPCPPDCPTLALSAPVVAGCAPSNAVATFSAALSWGAAQSPAAVSAYLWSVDWLDQSVSPPVQRKAQNSTPGPTLTPSIKSSDPGWSGNGAVAGRIDLSKPGSYTVSVQALISGVSPTTSCNAVSTSVPPFQVPPCTCPTPLGSGTEWTATNTTAPLGPNAFQALSCDSATVQLSLFVDPGSYAPGDLVYDWLFPDGTSVTGGSSTQTFTFANTPPGTTQTHKVTVTVRVNGSSCAPITRTVDITVPGCAGPGTPPNATGCSVTAGSGSGGSVAVTFDQDVDKTSAEDPTNYLVKIGSGPTITPAAGSISYNAGAKTATITGLTINPGDSVAVTVKGVKSTTGAAMTAAAQLSCAAAPKKGGGGFDWCSFLLVLSIILLLLGAIVVVIGVCISVPYVWIAGIIIGVIGLILFILWIILCSATTPCSLMQTMHCILFWLVGTVAPILVALSFIFGGVPCGLAAAAAWGGWGALYAWLGFIMGRVGCPRIC